MHQALFLFWKWKWIVLQRKLAVYFTAIFIVCGHILWPFGIFYGYSYFMVPVLVYCNKKNLATLSQ
jgi:hypothetical protein